MESWDAVNFADCQLGDKRLNQRALEIGKALVVGFGQALSMIFKQENALKRTYEFLANSKAQFNLLTQPHRQQTAIEAVNLPVVLAVGDTTYLDYKNIIAKREGYGPIGNGGNGLILHSTLAVEPGQGQSLGLLWQKLWHREHKAKPPANETPEQKKTRKAKERKAAREKPFEQKESYRWVEALMAVEKQFQAVEKLSQPTEQQLQQASELISPPRIIHIFDREGDIAEVFDHIRQMERTGVIVRAAHDRSLDPDNAHLWEYVSAQPIQFYQQVNLPETVKRKARTANLVIRFYPVQLRLPSRLKNSEPLNVYAVYAVEISPPEGEEAVEWMLLTTEIVTNEEQATTILRWYSYRWRVEEYHKILKSGCKAESYRLSATSMEALLGFLTVIAAELLRITYMHRTQPDSLATTVVSKVQLDVLKASASKLPKVLTVAWVIEEIAQLGGFLSHRRKTPIGIQVLWRGWLKLASLCEGWELAKS
jgi:hypothetical protein